VNLDEDNKRGLAVAMAKIIANRSKQRNFQLVLITHDEGFVSMMKDELSTQTGVSMPEKYFHVRREQSEDENYYSKIDSVDWEELMVSTPTGLSIPVVLSSVSHSTRLLFFTFCET